MLSLRSEEHTSELQSPAMISYAVFCLKKNRCPASGRFVAKENFVLAGLPVAARVFQRLESPVEFSCLIREGAPVEKGAVIATLKGDAADLLMGERVALNLLQRLSGIATVTARYVEQVRGPKARIVDTRKTTPGLRELEKYAVRVGGGFNHRTGLYDGVLIKENHITAAGGIAVAISRARAAIPHTLKIEIETENLAQVAEALAAGADIIMLDNMSLDDLRAAVALISGRVPVEASGGVTLERVRAIAETGVDIISVGALTHSSRAVDISMLLD